jgi:hypothetical protein
MECNKNGTYCDQKDPDPSVMVEATKKIIEFYSNARARAKVVVAYLSGPENDPVIAYVKKLGMPMIDIRLDGRSPEWDDFGRFDRHPGPIAQFNYFRKISKGLLDRGLIEGATN